MVKTTLLKVIFQGSHFTEIDRMVEVKGSVGSQGGCETAGCDDI